MLRTDKNRSLYSMVHVIGKLFVQASDLALFKYSPFQESGSEHLQRCLSLPKGAGLKIV